MIFTSVKDPRKGMRHIDITPNSNFIRLIQNSVIIPSLTLDKEKNVPKRFK